MSDLLEQLATSPSKSPLLSDPFATPGGGARPDRTISTYVEGVELSHLRFPEKVCLGLIGTTKVCCMARHTCSVASHRTKRAVGLDGNGVLLVRHTPSGHDRPACYLAPVLSTAIVNDDLINELLSTEDPDWAGTFGLIVGGGIFSLKEFYAKQDVMQTARKAVLAVNSPLKVEGRFEAKTVLDTLLELVDSLKSLPALLDKVDDVEESDGDDRDVSVTIALRAITVRLDFLGRSCQAALSGVHRVGNEAQLSERTYESSLEGISAEVDTLKGLLGERGSTVGPSEPTLWGAANGLRSRMDAMETAAGLLHANMENLRSFAGDIASRLGHSQAVNRKTPVLARTTGDESFSADTVMRDLLSSPEAGTGGTSYAGRYVDQSGVLHQPEADQYASHGGGAGRGGGAGNGNGGNGGAGLGGSFGTDGRNSVPGQDSPLSHIFARLDKLENKDSRQGVVEAVYFGDHFFGSEQDALAFLEKHLGVGANFKFGALTSPYHLLALVYKSLSGKSVGVAELASLKRLNLGHVELDAYLAASAELPELFTASTKLSGHAYKSNAGTISSARFKVLPAYSDWGNEGDETCLYEKVLRALRHVEDQVTANIRNAFRSSMELKMLAHDMLSASTKFLRDVFSYMGNTYLHLFSAFSNSSAAWDLVCFAVLEIFSNDFLPAKVDMANADIVTDVPSCAATVFWTNLKLVQVASKFSEVGIKNHPSMNSAYIRFILTQSSERQSAAVLERTVKAHEETISSLKRKFDEMDEKVKTYTNKFKFIESTVDNTKNKVTAVEKEVKKLKSGN